jgi:Ulp1 family protease
MNSRLQRNAFTELVMLGKKQWSDNDVKKQRLIQKGQIIRLIDTIVEELVIDKSFLETCNHMPSDMTNKKQREDCNRNTKHNRNTYKYQKETFKEVLVLVNDLETQDSNDLDDELLYFSPSKFVMVCKLA